MDFLVCQRGPLGYGKDIPLENIKNEKEAVSIAQNIALQTKEGFLVGLFTRDGAAICGWKTMEGGQLKKESEEVMQNSCGVGPGTFEFAKKQVDRLKKMLKRKRK
jgi:hypothetical protein